MGSVYIGLYICIYQNAYDKRIRLLLFHMWICALPCILTSTFIYDHSYTFVHIYMCIYTCQCLLVCPCLHIVFVRAYIPTDWSLSFMYTSLYAYAYSQLCPCFLTYFYTCIYIGILTDTSLIPYMHRHVHVCPHLLLLACFACGFIYCRTNPNLFDD